jgi:hypothetical protein
MDSGDLQPEQAMRLVESARRQLVYLNRLCERIQKLRWPIDDPVSRAATTAQERGAGLVDGREVCRG